MNLHEYQAKQLFAHFGIPVSSGEVAESPQAARQVAKGLGGSVWVVKAQIHAGGRGKGGGVKLAYSLDEVEAAAAVMLGTRLVTKQTGSKGLPVTRVFVETGSDIEKELYLSLLVDRTVERVAFIASAAGGMDIEEVAAATPDKILKVNVNPAAGLQVYQSRILGAGLGLDNEAMRQFIEMTAQLYSLFCECDAGLVEINPLIVNLSLIHI